MNFNFFKLSSWFIFISIGFIFLCFSSTISIFSANNEIALSNGSIILPENIILNFSNSEFLWPTPGYATITSYFGYRNAPTSGASTYHSGIDIGAPTRNKNFSYIFWRSNLLPALVVQVAILLLLNLEILRLLIAMFLPSF